MLKSTVAISCFLQVINVLNIVLLKNQSSVAANIETDSFHLNYSRLFDVEKQAFILDGTFVIIISSFNQEDMVESI